jgi:hypothetical protein
MLGLKYPFGQAEGNLQQFEEFAPVMNYRANLLQRP